MQEMNGTAFVKEHSKTPLHALCPLGKDSINILSMSHAITKQYVRNSPNNVLVNNGQ